MTTLPQPDAVRPPALPAARTVWKAAAVIAVAGGLLFVPLNDQYRALWYAEVSDAFHVPLFAVLGWLLVRYGWPGRKWPMVGLAAGIAVAAEVVQPLVGRSGSWRDLIYGLLGVAAAAVWMQKTWRWPWRLLLMAVLVAWPAWRTLPALFDAAWAWQTFPELAISGSPFEPRRWYLRDVQMERVDKAVRFDFAADKSLGNSAILFPIVRDWTAYETLEVSFEFAGEPLLFLISVRDGKKVPPELPRYDLWRRYPPGRHDVRIDLNELARGGRFPPIELHRVQSFHLVAYSDRPQTVTVHRIALSGRRQH